MTDFIRRNTLAVSHMTADVICLGGLFGYMIYLNKKMDAQVKNLEARVARLERRLASFASSSPPPPPPPPPPPTMTQQLSARPAPSRPSPPFPPIQRAYVPKPDEPILEEKDELICIEKEITEKEKEMEMDAEISEELEKLVDFVHLKQ
jgi:hypothetical protein